MATPAAAPPGQATAPKTYADVARKAARLPESAYRCPSATDDPDPTTAAVGAVDVDKLNGEDHTLYLCGLHNVSLSRKGKKFWALVCAQKPTFWIPRFQNNALDLYDIVKTWEHKDDIFFTKCIKKMNEIIKKTSDRRMIGRDLDNMLKVN